MVTEERDTNRRVKGKQAPSQRRHFKPYSLLAPSCPSCASGSRQLNKIVSRSQYNPSSSNYTRRDFNHNNNNRYLVAIEKRVRKVSNRGPIMVKRRTEVRKVHHTKYKRKREQSRNEESFVAISEVRCKGSLPNRTSDPFARKEASSTCSSEHGMWVAPMHSHRITSEFLMEQYTEQIEVEHINFQNGSMFPFFFNSNGNNNDNNNDNNSYNTSNTANSTAAAAASVETPVNLSSNSLSPEQS
jgi:hypothetical protein